MSVFTDIAKKMSPSGRKTLARFLAAAKEHKKLPVSLNVLPSGFLHCSIEAREAVGVLTSFGMRVALAAEALAQSEEDAA